MATLKRIDSFDITYADSFALTTYKVVEDFVHTDGTVAKKGMGEKRIYAGSDEAYLDDFFGLNSDDTPKFFLQKSDLLSYIEEATKELANPTYQYGSDMNLTLRTFNANAYNVARLTTPRVFFKFRKTFDDQKRYYLVLESGTENKTNYDYIRNIALPRVTRFLFIKLYDEQSKKFYIYIKPVIWDKKNELADSSSEHYKVHFDDNKSSAARKYREGQVKYREDILKQYPYCVVTKVTDPDLLEAAHIKEHCNAKPEEKYDKYNGFSMTPTIHHLFDIGYLSFNENGEMILSEFFRNMDRKKLNLDGTIRVEIRNETKPYLQWHNEHVFKCADPSIYTI